MIIRDEQPLENIQVCRYCVAVNILVIHSFNILHQGLIRDGSALVPCQRTQQQTHFLRITLYAIYAVHIIVNDGVQVFRRKQHRLLQRQSETPGPAATEDQLDQLPEIYFAGHCRSKFTVTQLFQRDLAAGIAGLI